MKLVTTFAGQDDYERARAVLRRLSLRHQILRPPPVPGVAPGLVVEEGGRRELLQAEGGAILFAGWVDGAADPPDEDDLQAGPENELQSGDIFGRAALTVLAPCVADPTKIRVIAQVSGDASAAFCYLNAEMSRASYNLSAPTLTYMEGHRMVSLHPHRIAIAKADDLTDAWSVLARIRSLVTDVWSRRDQMTPSYELHRRPPSLEIFKRLPGTNCKACGELTCLAFADRLWRGEADPQECRQVFEGDHGHLREALREICAGLAVGG